MLAIVFTRPPFIFLHSITDLCLMKDSFVDSPKLRLLFKEVEYCVAMWGMIPCVYMCVCVWQREDSKNQYESTLHTQKKTKLEVMNSVFLLLKMWGVSVMFGNTIEYGGEPECKNQCCLQKRAHLSFWLSSSQSVRQGGHA